MFTVAVQFSAIRSERRADNAQVQTHAGVDAPSDWTTIDEGAAVSGAILR